jgi:hypothetical protein
LSAICQIFLKEVTIMGPDICNPSFRLDVRKDKESNVRFQVDAGLRGFNFSFTQTGRKDKTDPANPKTLTNRIFRASIREIPMPDNIPLMKTLEKPFDELGFLWVNRDLTKTEVQVLDPSIQFDKGAEGGEEVIVMSAGFHFVIIANSKCVLDYPFSKPKAPNSAHEEKKDENVGTGDLDKSTASGAPSNTSAVQKQSPKAKYKKTIGPLSISNVGFKYEGSTLSILLDATFEFGPVAFSLYNFTLGLHFETKPKSSGNTATDFFSNLSVQVSISGFGIEYDKPPLSIGGDFLVQNEDGNVLYTGGVAVGFAPWLFQAAGFYGEMNVAGRDTPLKCFFIYATLRGPVVSFAYADISGLTLAFAYNVDITIPTIERVTQFPLLTPSTHNVTPQETIREMIKKDNPYFNPQDGASWFAAGLTLTAFQMLQVTALVVVQWSPSVKFAILGVAICDVPSKKLTGGTNIFQFAHVELGILATVDPQAGLFKVEAQLSPNSYILHPDCHLTGGFAMYVWFKDGDNGATKGDWVCTIGGYHSAFVVPKSYPNPDRLKISWTVNDSLSITGEAYFAITPKVCMGGVRIRASLCLGALRAWFDAYADFLINFAPFHFQATGHVSVGISFSMSVWFVTVSISAEIGATLTLAGPPLGGTVHVDFWVFGFDIEFGSQGTPEDPLLIRDFWKLVLQAETPPKDAKAGIDGDPKDAHLFICNQGLIASSSTDVKAEDPWYVRGGVFEFSLTAYFAINAISLNDMPVAVPAGLNNVYAKPMQITDPLESNLTITITEGEAKNKKSGWILSPMIKAVPQGMWGPCE